MSERVTNINIGGGNIGGLQIGDNNQQTIHQQNGDQVPTVPQVFGSIRSRFRQSNLQPMTPRPTI